MDSALLAHGYGGRQDLPIPLPAAVTGAVVALLATFLVLNLAWGRSRFRGAQAGRPLPAPLARGLDAKVFRWALRTAGLVAAGWLLVSLVAGPGTTADSPGPGALYVVMWVWVPLGSVLLGPIWRAVNPLRTVHLLLARATGTDPATGPVPLPRNWGYWPAAVTLSAFVWLELVAPDRGTVPVVFVALATYAAVMLAGAGLCGAGWFDRADPFEVYSSLAARLAPVGRRGDGVLVLRNPFHGLDSLPPVPGLAAVVLVLLGSTAFDSLSGARWWLQFVQDRDVPTLAGTLGLAGSIGLLAAAYVLAVRAAGRQARDQARDGGPAPGGRRTGLPALFAHSLLPIALGYLLAHYYSLAVIEGQRTVILAADPLGTGTNLLGRDSTDIGTAMVDPVVVATVQVAAVVCGHIAGAVAAHDRAARLFPPRVARYGQLPLLGLMVGYTYLGLSLLLAT